MFCENCGKQIDDDAKFCKYCGASIELKAETVSNENSEQKVSAVRDSASDYTSSVKRKSYIIIAVIIAVPIILIIAVLLLMSLSDKKNFEKNEEEIQKVQDSYFEFLPEMTVGDLLYEYYGEDYWAYNVDNVVEFWGTNQKDKSGLALNFDSVKADNTVGVTYRMYHEENEAAHSISEEEFEEYILSLYAQLDENYQITDITTKSETTPTTTAKVTTTTVTTTVTKEQEKMEESKYYLAYLMFLNEMNASIKREYGDIYVPYYQYYLYDINHDDFYELILHVGESEADASILFYTIDEESEDGFIKLGEFGGGHTVLVEKDKKLYADYCHQGYQIVNEIQMVGWHDVWSITEETIIEEGGLSDYESYGTPIVGYDISDTSAIEALCPKELLEDKPYVDGYVETYSLSGQDGGKSYLYLDGDFSGVSIQIQNREYTSEVEFYSKEDFDDYIDLKFNAFAQPSSVVYVTPYSDLGVAGDVITCDIPSDISGTISTGGMSYSVDNMKGQINCHGGTVAGFTTDYVVNGGAVGKVRNSLGDTWHVTAKNLCYNYGVTWYELWDSDDGDYYGWVDSSYIDFY